MHVTRPRLIERDAALAVVCGALAAGPGGDPRGVVVVEGGSGVGKTRLLEAAIERVSAGGALVLIARASELEREFAFGVVLRLLERVVLREDALRGRGALARPLLEPDAAFGFSDEFSLVHGLYWCVVNLAERGPLVLCVDDVHWADEQSMQFVNYLARRLDDLPVAVLVTVRAGDPSARSDAVRRLYDAAGESVACLAELSPAGAEALLEDAGASSILGPELVELAGQVTGGNPFLLHSLAAAVRADPERWAGAAGAELEAFAPDAVARTVSLRLTRLGEDAVALARAVAIAGEGRSAVFAGRLVGMDAPQALEAAEAVLAERILVSVEPATFGHAMVRSAVMAEMPVGVEQALRLAAARALHEDGASAEEVARHLLAGAVMPEPWAIDALRAAGKAAAGRGALRVAMECFRRAMDIELPPTVRASLLLDLGLVEASAGEETSLARFEQALGAVACAEDRATALYALGQAHYRSGRPQEAVRAFRRGAELFEREDPDQALLFNGSRVCAEVVFSGFHLEPVQALARPLVGRAPMTVGERVVLAALSHVRSLGSPTADEAAVDALAALGDGELVRAQTAESMAAKLAIVALVWSGRPVEAEAAADIVLADARERGAAVAFAETSFVRAIALLERGRIDEAAADLQVAISGVEGRGWHAYGPVPRALMTLCLLERGELGDAEAMLAHAAQELTGLPAVDAWFRYARARMDLEQGHAAGALEGFAVVGELLARAGIHNPAVLRWRLGAAFAAAMCERGAEAAAFASEQRLEAERFGLPDAVAEAEIALALRGQADVKALGRAVAQLDGRPVELVRVRGLISLGGALRRQGRRQDCRPPLREAMDVAQRLGARAVEGIARSELAASGAKPRRAAASGVAALTPSERRIALLAASGASNREIAERLFLTRNTVAWHLSRVYRKLSVESRAELARRLA